MHIVLHGQSQPIAMFVDLKKVFPCTIAHLVTIAIAVGLYTALLAVTYTMVTKLDAQREVLPHPPSKLAQIEKALCLCSATNGHAILTPLAFETLCTHPLHLGCATELRIPESAGNTITVPIAACNRSV